MTADQWNNVGTSRTLAYDPSRGDLLVEIRITNGGFVGTTSGMHEHARQALIATGFADAPPRTGTLVNVCPNFRICDDLATTDRFGTGCGPGPLVIQSNGSSSLGSSFDLWLTNGNPAPSSLVGIAIGAQHRVFGIAPGCTVHTNGEASWLLFMQNGTSPSVTIPVPNNPLFLGTKLYAQGGNVHPGGSAIGITVSDYLLVTVWL